MKITTPSKANLFLLELIIVILFFALAAAVSVQLFAESRDAAAQSRDLTRATLIAQTAAESLKSVNGDAEALAALLGGTATAGSVTVAYDADWQPCTAPGSYRLAIEMAAADELLAATITVAAGETAIYTLEQTLFTGGEVMP